MEICCPKSIKGVAILVTRNDACDRSVDPLTPNSRILTPGFMELSIKPDVEAGEETLSKNASGQICTFYKDIPRLKGFDLELKLCGVPLALIELLTGATLLPNEDGSIGGAVLKEAMGAVNPDSKGVEIWSLNPEKNCTSTNNNLYIRWALPKTINWEIGGDMSFGNTELEITLTGYAMRNPMWVPSFPNADFPKWVPGGGNPDSVPSPTYNNPVLPDGISEDEWLLDDQIAIRAGGPLAWRCVGQLPAALDACGYLPSESALGSA